MFFKKIKKTVAMLLLTFFIIPGFTYAYSDYIVAGGNNIGMELKSDGVMIVGLYKVNDIYPAENSGLKVGDIITSVNGKVVSNINEMVSQIDKSSNKEDVKIEYLRNDKINVTSLKLIMDKNGTFKTGLYVKDSISGIGTLSFIDPETRIFGALGHEIIEKSTGEIFDIKDGKIYESNVTGIIKSENGNPGEKNATIYSDKVIGTIKENTDKGIFGTYDGFISKNNVYKVANVDDIETGEAKIMTVLNADDVKYYDINIIKLSDKQDTKNILFEITDDELLEKTGGIIQGMSGSPIIQNEYIIGAVTHVVVDNPTKGYGIFITNMLEEAEN